MFKDLLATCCADDNKLLATLPLPVASGRRTKKKLLLFHREQYAVQAAGLGKIRATVIGASIANNNKNPCLLVYTVQTCGALSPLHTSLSLAACQLFLFRQMWVTPLLIRGRQISSTLS